MRHHTGGGFRPALPQFNIVCLSGVIDTAPTVTLTDTSVTLSFFLRLPGPTPETRPRIMVSVDGDLAKLSQRIVRAGAGAIVEGTLRVASADLALGVIVTSGATNATPGLATILAHRLQVIMRDGRIMDSARMERFDEAEDRTVERTEERTGDTRPVRPLVSAPTAPVATVESVLSVTARTAETAIPRERSRSPRLSNMRRSNTRQDNARSDDTRSDNTRPLVARAEAELRPVERPLARTVEHTATTVPAPLVRERAVHGRSRRVSSAVRSPRVSATPAQTPVSMSATATAVTATLTADRKTVRPASPFTLVDTEERFDPFFLQPKKK